MCKIPLRVTHLLPLLVVKVKSTQRERTKHLKRDFKKKKLKIKHYSKFWGFSSSSAPPSSQLLARSCLSKTNRNNQQPDFIPLWQRRSYQTPLTPRLQASTLKDVSSEEEHDGYSGSCLTVPCSTGALLYLFLPTQCEEFDCCCERGPPAPCSSVPWDCDKLQLGSFPSPVPPPRSLWPNAVSKVNPGPICYNTFVLITFSPLCDHSSHSAFCFCLPQSFFLYSVYFIPPPCPTSFGASLGHHTILNIHTVGHILIQSCHLGHPPLQPRHRNVKSAVCFFSAFVFLTLDAVFAFPPPCTSLPLGLYTLFFLGHISQKEREAREEEKILKKGDKRSGCKGWKRWQIWKERLWVCGLVRSEDPAWVMTSVLLPLWHA